MSDRACPRRGGFKILILSVLVCLIGGYASYTNWRMIRDRENSVAASEFFHITSERAESIQRELHDTVELLYSIRSFFNGSSHVSADEFRVFTAPLLARNESVLAFEWLPRLSLNERFSFENRLSKRFGKSISISQIGTGRHLETAPPRDVYFPVEFLVEQKQKKISAIGFDHASDPPRWWAMKQALELDLPIATERLKLFRVDAEDEEDSGLLVAMPIFRNRDSATDQPSTIESKPAERDLSGFVIGLFQIDEVVENALKGFDSRGVDFVLYDPDSESSKQLLYQRESGKPFSNSVANLERTAFDAGSSSFNFPIQIANRRWIFSAVPSEDFFQVQRSWSSTGLLIASLFATVAVSICVYLMASRANRIQELVQRRTRQLADANEKVVQSEAKVKAIVKTAIDAIVTVNDVGRIQSFNPAFEKMFSVSHLDAVRLNIEQVVPGIRELCDEIADEVDDTLELAGLKCNSVAQRLDGSEFPIEMALSQSHVEGQQFFTAIIRDISMQQEAALQLQQQAEELSKANEVLAEKNSELDEFTYVASHDLQEPVRKLISFSKLLQQDLGDDLSDRAETDLHYIVDAAYRMRQLIEDLLALSRAGRNGLKHELVSLDQAAATALDTLQLEIEETGAEISQDPLPEVMGDPTVLTQLYQNLISNSLKFVDGKQPKISLTAERSGDHWLLGVKDNGIGIKPEYAERIFQPFQRLHGRSEYSGTGIGLAICKKAVQRHGGQIHVESTPGEGTHFKFTLPIKLNQAETWNEEAAEEELSYC